MANYYTRFSFVFPLKEQVAREFALVLAAQVKIHRFEEEAPVDFPAALVDALEDWNFEIQEQEEELWFHSENDGVQAVCLFLQYLMQRFDRAGRVAFEWSEDCSQPRTDAYGGGAAIVTATSITTMSTSRWLREQEEIDGTPLPAKNPCGDASNHE